MALIIRWTIAHFLVFAALFVLANSTNGQVGGSPSDETLLRGKKCQARNLKITQGQGKSRNKVLFSFSGRPYQIPPQLKRRNFAEIAVVNSYFTITAQDALEAVIEVCDITTTYDEVVSFLFCTQGGVQALPSAACPQIKTVSAKISPAQGGQVSLSDGTKLDVPPGAVSKDTNVSITRLDPAGGTQVGHVVVLLQPEGLTFPSESVPTLVVPLPSDTPVDRAVAYFDSSLNPVIDLGDELSQRVPAEVIEEDEMLNTVRLRVPHFSAAVFTIYNDVVIVPHLSGQYLRKGDIFFSADAGPTPGSRRFSPGHTGLYLGVKPGEANSFGNDGKSVIESTPGTPGVIPNSQRNLATVNFGARRPTSFLGLTASQTAPVTSQVAAAAESFLGLPYMPTGWTFPFFYCSGNSLTCAQLVAATYKSVNVDVIGPFGNSCLAEPASIFFNVSPIDQVTIKAEEPFNFSVNAYRLKKTLLGLIDKWYDPTDISLVASQLPSWLGYSPSSTSSGTIAGTPGTSELCSSGIVTLSAITVPEGKTLQQSMIVHVGDMTIEDNIPTGVIDSAMPTISARVSSHCSVPLAFAHIFLDDNRDGKADILGGVPQQDRFERLVGVASQGSDRLMSFTPTQALFAGTHWVRAVGFNENGLREELEWSFDIDLGTNIALNPSRTGFPSPLESDRGWGGGSYPWEIVDGLRSYSHWAHGLAFTGGHRDASGGPPWIEPAGWRQATINFGAPKTFHTVVIWHHGVEYTPAQAFLDYWDGNQWVPISFQRQYGTMHEEGQNSGYSDSDIYTFAPVTGNKVRYSFDNRGNNINGTLNIHGWIYEFEVFGQP
jgi:hypothetical protein